MEQSPGSQAGMTLSWMFLRRVSCPARQPSRDPSSAQGSLPKAQATAVNLVFTSKKHPSVVFQLILYPALGLAKGITAPVRLTAC